MGRDEGLPASSAQLRPIVNNSADAALPLVDKILSRLLNYESPPRSFEGLPGDLRVQQ